MFDDFGNDIERRLEEILMPVSCEYSDLLENTTEAIDGVYPCLWR